MNRSMSIYLGGIFVVVVVAVCVCLSVVVVVVIVAIEMLTCDVQKSVITVVDVAALCVEAQLPPMMYCVRRVCLWITMRLGLLLPSCLAAISCVCGRGACI